MQLPSRAGVSALNASASVGVQSREVASSFDSLTAPSAQRCLGVGSGGLRGQANLQTLFVSITQSFDQGGFEALNIEHLSVWADVCGKQSVCNLVSGGFSSGIDLSLRHTGCIDFGCMTCVLIA